MKNTISIYNPHRHEIHVNQIKYIEGQSNYSILHLTDSKPIIISRTVLKLASQLPTFVRIHKRYLVNPRFFTPNQQLKPGKLTLELTTGEVLPVSRRRIADLSPVLSSAHP